MSTDLLILIAEDDDGHAYLIRQGLADAGFRNEVAHVADGQTALDFVRCEGDYRDRDCSRPLLLLLDLSLPRVNGEEVLRQIKSDPRTREVPVVVLTLTDDPREVRRCYDLGCSSYVVKPVAPPAFTEAILRLGLFLAVVRVPDPHPGGWGSAGSGHRQPGT